MNKIINDKIYLFFKKHLILSIIIVMSILMAPIFIINLLYLFGDILEEHAINTVFEADDLLSYFGTILSVFIGAIGTFGALYITIQFEKEDRRKERRLQFYPYLRYTIIDNYYCNHNRNDKVIDINITPPPYEMEVLRNPIHKTIQYKNDFSFYLMIENIGINSAVNYSILKMNYFGQEDLSILGLGDIKVQEKKYIKFNVLINARGKLNINQDLTGSIPINIKIAYTNIIGDYYEQDIIIYCTWFGSKVIDESGNVISKEYGPYFANIGKHDISKPCYFEGRNIEDEEIKKLNSFKSKKNN